MKTTTIIERAKWLVENGADPATLLLLTFTNYAANVMMDRIRESIPDANIFAGTFHSFCYRLLKERLPSHKQRFTVSDEDDQKAILTKLGAKQSISNIIEHINICKSIDGVYSKYTDICAKYDDYLEKHNLMDFGDLQIKALDYIDDVPYKHIFIDEFHDTSPMQLEIIKKLEPQCNTLTIVCDDQQSIYSWRGADINNILKIKELYPATELITLNRNYRSTKVIVNSTNNLISHATEKLCDKDMYTDRKYGQEIYINECDTEDIEADLVAKRIKSIYNKVGNYGDNMVLFRTNAQSRALEYALAKNAIPYQLIASVSFYKRKEIKDIIAYLRYILNDMDEPALHRIINTPTRGIGKATISKMVDEYGSLCEAVNSINDLNRVHNKIYWFKTAISPMRLLAQTKGIGDLIKDMLDVSQYYRKLQEDGSDDSKRRLGNIDSLLDNAYHLQKTYNYKLGEYMAMVALVSDSDSLDEGGSVKLMTIHASKGLESKYVHVVGVENNVLPHMNSDVNEERRLMYVAISRAMDICMLTYCKKRIIGGKFMFTGMSNFIGEIQNKRGI